MKRLMIGICVAVSVFSGVTVAAPETGTPRPGVLAPGQAPTFQRPPLPYAENALEPYISAKTMSLHYGKHHQGYVDKLNELTAGTPWTENPIEEVVRGTAGNAKDAAIFNNAAQAWNHTFFWHSMKPEGGGRPAGRLMEQILKTFGTFDDFKKEFIAAGNAQFGSGWIWLVKDGKNLKLVKTSNADTPIAHDLVPLLVCDVWEHAYYLDYQNRRGDYLKAFLDRLANWEFAASQWDPVK